MSSEIGPEMEKLVNVSDMKDFVNDPEMEDSVSGLEIEEFLNRSYIKEIATRLFGARRISVEVERKPSRNY